MDERWEKLRRLAGQQHGQLSTHQVAALGFSDWERRVLMERGQLGHDAIRLFAVVSAEGLSHRGRLWAVQLSVQRLVVACTFSALWCYGLGSRRPPEQMWVVVRGKWAPSRPDVTVLTSRNLPDEDITGQGGLLLTTIERTIVDLAAFLSPARLRGILLDARQRGLTDEERVAAVGERRLGARGVVGLLRLCEQVAANGADSQLEAVFRDKVAESSLPPPTPDQLIITTHNGGTRKLDVAWPQQMVGAECDGLAYHGSRAAHDADAVRRTELNLTPFRIVHVTWARVELHWAALESDLWTALRLGGRRTG